jgi:hypothetical protein
LFGAEFLEKTKREHGTIVGLLLGGERVVLISEPEAAKQVGGGMTLFDTVLFCWAVSCWS